MLFTSDTIWNANQLSSPLEKERRLCCNTTTTVNTTGNTNENDEVNSEYEAVTNTEKVLEKIGTVRNSIANAITKQVSVNNTEQTTSTPYKSADSAYRTIKEYAAASKNISNERQLFDASFNKEHWNEVANTLEDNERILLCIQQWLGGGLHPDEFLNDVRALQGILHNGKSKQYRDAFIIAKQIHTIAIRELGNRDWLTIEEKVKMSIIMTTAEQLPIISGFCYKLEQEALRYKDDITEIQKLINQHNRNPDIAGQDEFKEKSRTSKGWGFTIKTITFLQAKKGFQDWFSALKRSFLQHSDVKAANFAKMLGKFTSIIPADFAKDTEKILDEDLNNANKKIRDGYLDLYNSDGPTYRAIFASGGLWDGIGANDTQRKLALLLYAADKGWLYGVASGTPNTPLAGKIRLVDIVGEGAGTQAFFEDLQEMNQKGLEKSKDRGYNRVKQLENPDRIQEELRKALQGLDLPGAVGIAKRANEKGLNGRTNERMLVAIYEAARDPLFRQAVDAEWIDSIAKINANDATIGLGFLKTTPERNAFLNWCKNYNKLGGEMNEENIGVSGDAIATARRLLLKYKPELRDEKNRGALNDAIADLLGSKIIECTVNGRKRNLSIWMPEFSRYRNSPQMKEFNAGNHNEETDYDYSNQDSSQIMRSAKVWKHILKTGSEGSLDQGLSDQATAFLSKVIKYKKNMLDSYLEHDINKAQYMEFYNTVRANFNSWVEGEIQGELKVKFATIKDPTGKNTYLIKTLLEEKLLDPMVLVKQWFTGTKKVVDIIIKQLHPKYRSMNETAAMMEFIRENGLEEMARGENYIQ